MVIFHRDDRRHLCGQIGVKAGDLNNVIPASAGILQDFSDSLESAGVVDSQIGLADPSAGNYAR